MTEKTQNIVLPKNWKQLSVEQQTEWLNERYTLKSDITTEVKRQKKPHDKFNLRMQLDSTPVELNVEASNTEIGIKDLTRNPKKFSFGTIAFKTGKLEFYIYPLKNLNSALASYNKGISAKGNSFSMDYRRTKELRNLITKIRYFQSLSKKRKLEYLQKKGYFANINIIEDKLSLEEKTLLEYYLELLGEDVNN